MGNAERGVVLLLVGVAVLGHAVRRWAGPVDKPGEALLLTGAAGAPEAQRRRAVVESRPLAEGETIDPDLATAVELARLPGVGMRLAKQIVADRAVRGPFGHPEALSRVPGIGPATVRRLEPFLRFSAPRRAPERLDLNAADQAELERLPGIGAVKARAILAYRQANGPFADPADLARVPGIGGALATRLAPLVRVR